MIDLGCGLEIPLPLAGRGQGWGEDTSVTLASSPHPALNIGAEPVLRSGALRATLPVMAEPCFQHEGRVIGVCGNLRNLIGVVA